MKQKLSFLGIAFAVLCAGKTIAGEPSKSILFNTVTDSSATQVTRTTHRNVAKLNLFSLGLTNISLQYEYAFHKNMSAALGFSIMPSRGLPSFVPTTSDSIGILKAFKFSGFSITPEFRWYPGKKLENQAPHGFYLAPYFRYSSYSLSTIFPYKYPQSNLSGGVDTTIINMDITAKYSGFGVGLMIGAQWIIKNRVSIDWWILGGHYGSSSPSISFSNPLISQISANPTAVQAFKDQIESISKSLPMGKMQGDMNGSTATATITGLPFVGIRAFGLTLGYAF